MIGRPQSSEAAPYYFTYVNRVHGEDVIAVLSNQLDETLMMCAKVSEEQSFHRYAEEKWSIRQVINHVTDSERVFAFRAFWFARGFETALPSYDQNIASAGAEADGTSWAAHVEEFRRVRLSSIALFENMPPKAWMRGGIASDNYFTVRALAYIIAGHLAHHASLLLKEYGLT